MKLMKNKNNIRISELRSILIGGGISILACILLSAIAAWMIGDGITGYDKMDLASVAVVFVSAFAGSIACGLLTDGKILLCCVASNLLFFVVLLSINILFFDGQISGLAGKTIAIAAATAASVLLKLVIMRGSSNRKFRMR